MPGIRRYRITLIDPDSIEELALLVDRIEEAPDLIVVVFDSTNTAYFMAHWDLRADRRRVAAMKPGPTGLNQYADNLFRLSKVRVDDEQHGSHVTDDIPDDARGCEVVRWLHHDRPVRAPHGESFPAGANAPDRAASGHSDASPGTGKLS